jgi:uncharacterized repeat protein (TIGR03847 family)
VARVIRTFSAPQRVVIGTVGLPGERTFYLQADDESSRVWIRMEKQQVATLAEQMQRFVVTLVERGMSLESPIARDEGPLDTPIDEDFAAVAVGLGWDEDKEKVIIELHALGDEEPADFGDDTDEGADTVRVWFSLGEAEAFAARALSVVAAGRPECPLCQLPLEATGHICPRANGYRRLLS